MTVMLVHGRCALSKFDPQQKAVQLGASGTAAHSLHKCKDRVGKREP